MLKRIGLLLSLIVMCLAGISAGAAGPATPGAQSTPVDCPVTQPNEIQPPASGNAFGAGWGDFGNEYLWTSLWTWGQGAIWVPDDEYHFGNGQALDLKWPWYRFVEGDLIIEGHRLDAEAPPLERFVPNDSYGQSGFIATGLSFPADGCWEITGTVGDHTLTFVVLVLFPPDYSGITPPWATPVATPA